MRAGWFGLLVSLTLAVASCSGDDEEPKATGSGGSAGSGSIDAGVDSSPDTSTGGTAGAAGSDDGSLGGASGDGGTSGAGPFALGSSAFGEGDTIPEKYACNSADSGAQNASPPLAWSPGPAGTESYAIVMRDLDFGNGFLHWVMWDIPKGTLSIPENIEHVYQPSTPAGAKQAIFQGAVYGYFGPCSPGVNTYELSVYALPEATLPGVDQNSTKQAVASAIAGAALAVATLSGES
jgi:Raf kinase inhibitor-like YbhB/YbcL family protein